MAVGVANFTIRLSRGPLSLPYSPPIPFPMEHRPLSTEKSTQTLLAEDPPTPLFSRTSLNHLTPLSLHGSYFPSSPTVTTLGFKHLVFPTPLSLLPTATNLSGL
jgi:hypothetical protein